MEASQENLFVDLGAERVKVGVCLSLMNKAAKKVFARRAPKFEQETHHFFLVVPNFVLMLNSWRLLSREHFLCWLLVPAGLLIVTVAIERLSVAFTANSKREFVPHDEVFHLLNLLFTVYYNYMEIGRFKPILSITIVLSCFYLPISHLEIYQLESHVCHTRDA